VDDFAILEFGISIDSNMYVRKKEVRNEIKICGFQTFKICCKKKTKNKRTKKKKKTEM